MSADAGWPLQEALYAKLKTALAPDEVYDHVPEGTPYRYVTIGEATAIDGGSKTEVGQEHTVTVHAWSRGRGRKETKELLGKVYAALHQQPLTVNGHEVSLIRFEFADSFLDPDGLTYHGVHRYRIITTEA